jgi:hypothetical protein
MRQVTADQGSQPRFGRVRVGIMRAGGKQGVRTARLAVRTPDESRIVDVAEGSTVDVPGHGSLTVTGVHRRPVPEGRESVDLEWRDEGEVRLSSRR